MKSPRSKPLSLACLINCTLSGDVRPSQIVVWPFSNQVFSAAVSVYFIETGRLAPKKKNTGNQWSPVFFHLYHREGDDKDLLCLTLRPLNFLLIYISDHYFHTTVTLSAFFRSIAALRMVFTKATGNQPRFINTSTHQCIGY